MSEVIPLHGVPPARQPALERAIAAQLLSDRHRLWGQHCPVVDLDFVPYNGGLPTGLIEYKHEYGKPLSLEAERRALLRPTAVLIELVKPRQDELPFFMCRYAADFSWFKVAAMNEAAERALRVKRACLDEIQYVRFLWSLSGRRPPRWVEKNLTGLPQLDF